MCYDISFFNEKQYSLLFIEGKLENNDDVTLAKILGRYINLPLTELNTGLIREQHQLLPINLKKNYFSPFFT